MEQNATVLGEGLYRLDRDALAALAQELCRQLTERGAYHGGIRPDNIGCDEQGRVFLGEDVGGDVNREWTPAELEYMAPEVFWSGTRNPAADVYSIGMLLYAGVTGGQLPFTPKNPSPNDQAEALRRRMSGEALPIPKTAGKHLGAVIEKATQFRADDRYESPAALDAVLADTREAIRNYIPPAREMLCKPVQELTDMERLLLAGPPAVLKRKPAAPKRRRGSPPNARPPRRRRASRPSAEPSRRRRVSRQSANQPRRQPPAARFPSRSRKNPLRNRRRQLNPSRKSRQRRPRRKRPPRKRLQRKRQSRSKSPASTRRSWRPFPPPSPSAWRSRTRT